MNDRAVHQTPTEALTNQNSLADGLKQWSTQDHGKTFLAAGETMAELIPGMYEIRTNERVGLYFERVKIKQEGLIRFPDTVSDMIIAQLQTFWAREQFYRYMGILYKRSILTWGPPGNGKSSLIQIVMADVIALGGVVFKFTYPSLFMSGLRQFREIQPNTPVVVIMEDLDSIMSGMLYPETEVLQILDGVDTPDKLVFLATTNYPERLGERVINRPVRFDWTCKIGPLSAESRRIYFEHLVAPLLRDAPEAVSADVEAALGRIELDRWVEDTSELSIAHLKELFTSVVMYDSDYDETMVRLRGMKKAVSSTDNGNELGFRSSPSSQKRFLVK